MANIWQFAVYCGGGISGWLIKNVGWMMRQSQVTFQPHEQHIWHPTQLPSQRSFADYCLSVCCTDLAVVRCLLDHFRRHPERCSNKRAFLVHSVSELTSNAKVRQLYISTFRQQHVRSYNTHTYVTGLTGNSYQLARVWCNDITTEHESPEVAPLDCLSSTVIN